MSLIRHYEGNEFFTYIFCVLSKPENTLRSTLHVCVSFILLFQDKKKKKKARKTVLDYKKIT